MNRTKSTLLFIIIFAIGGPVLSAQTDIIRIRTIVAMEPIGLMNSWRVSYGFSPGLELYLPIGDRLELGAGFQWQVQRRLVSTSSTDGIPDNAWFSYKPIYIAARIHITTLEKVRLHALLRAGFNFFEADDAFGQVWTVPLIEYSGGLYAAAGLGVNIPLIQRPVWEWEFSMETGYAYHGATGNDGTRNRTLSYQLLMTNFGFDWRF